MKCFLMEYLQSLPPLQSMDERHQHQSHSIHSLVPNVSWDSLTTDFGTTFNTLNESYKRRDCAQIYKTIQVLINHFLIIL